MAYTVGTVTPTPCEEAADLAGVYAVEMYDRDTAHKIEEAEEYVFDALELTSARFHVVGHVADMIEARHATWLREDPELLS